MSYLVSFEFSKMCPVCYGLYWCPPKSLMCSEVGPSEDGSIMVMGALYLSVGYRVMSSWPRVLGGDGAARRKCIAGVQLWKAYLLLGLFSSLLLAAMDYIAFLTRFFCRAVSALEPATKF